MQSCQFFGVGARSNQIQKELEENVSTVAGKRMSCVSKHLHIIAQRDKRRNGGYRGRRAHARACVCERERERENERERVGVYVRVCMCVYVRMYMSL